MKSLFQYSPNVSNFYLFFCLLIVWFIFTRMWIVINIRTGFDYWWGQLSVLESWRAGLREVTAHTEGDVLRNFTLYWHPGTAVPCPETAFFRALSPVLSHSPPIYVTHTAACSTRKRHPTYTISSFRNLQIKLVSNIYYNALGKQNRQSFGE